MKMSRKAVRCLLTLFLAVTSVSAAIRKQNQIESLKGLQKIDFDQSVPKHSLMLLHWFANTVDIDNNNIISLTFEPNSDYGSHRYYNSERLLDALPRGHAYYTVGNIRQDTSRQLPDYVSNPPREYRGENSDRIIFHVQGQTIRQVFITQHWGRSYDPDHTYEITPHLLRQIREFSVRQGQLPLLYLRNHYDSNANVFQIRSTWQELACLGLFLFIVLEEKHFANQRNNRPVNNRQQTNRAENNIWENNVLQINNVPPNYTWPNNNVPPNNIQPNNNVPPINNRQSKCSGCTRVLICSCVVILVIVTIVVSIYYALSK